MEHKRETADEELKFATGGASEAGAVWDPAAIELAGKYISLTMSMLRGSAGSGEQAVYNNLLQAKTDLDNGDIRAAYDDTAAAAGCASGIVSKSLATSVILNIHRVLDVLALLLGL